MKCKQTLIAYAVFSGAVILTAVKGTIDWMGLAVIGGVLIPGCRKWIAGLFKRK